MEILSIKGVTKSFGKKEVLQNINVSIKKGEIFGLIGRTGSGKSVLIKIIIGFLKPDTGKIILNNSIKNKINFSMQHNSIYDYLTVKQNLKYFAKIYGLSKKERKIAIPEIIDRLSLKEFENVIIKKLSGGTQKKVDIGCSLLNNPDILIFDEPFLGLDPELVAKLGEFIWDLNKKGKTIIISSHDITQLKRICSKFAIIKNKNLIMVNKENLLEAYK